MNYHHVTPGGSAPQDRMRTAVAHLLDREVSALGPVSATLTLCVIGNAQELALATVRLILIAILVAIVLGVQCT
ncbi:hypothetical protein AB0C96_26860 [Streptomyces sp. NPDC048506]|uniref:hypothetical protein n=1 Tax=Streptomyces sp. NPDC048506 TaxID=3155028 RepID=UPI0034179681